MHALNHTEVERLAYQLWEKRGRPIGSPEVDWCQAERMLYKLQGDTIPVAMFESGPGTGPWRAPDCPVR